METDLQFYLGMLIPFWPFALALLVILLIFVALYLFRRWQSGSESRQIDQWIKNYSVAYLKDIVLPDGVYGYHFIDYLVLFPDKVLVLGIQPNEGYIFGADQLEQWTQVVNNKSYRFENPLLKIAQYQQTISPLLGGVEVVGRVVFFANSSFPKGKPSDILEMYQLEDELRKLAGSPVTQAATSTVNSAAATTITPTLMAHWQVLQDAAKIHRKSYQQEVTQTSLQEH